MEAVGREILRQETDESREKIAEKLTTLLHSAAKEVLSGVEYREEMTGPWIEEISELALGSLVERNLTFKYVLECLIVQAGRGNCHLASSVKQHGDTDIQRQVAWENEHIKFVGTITCLKF